MSELDDRQGLMQRDVLLVAIAAMSLLNGMHFSPYYDPVAILLKPFLAGTLLGTPIVFLYLASLFTSLMTLLIAGIPAALYERAKGLADSTPVSLGIWLGCLFAVTVPTFIGMSMR
jgi:hypothetical protein